MPDSGTLKKWVSDIFYSFPVQLVILHLRSHILLLGLWIYLWLLMTGALGKTFGVKYLFLDPEYLGSVDVRSFCLVGAAFGVFFMSWNLTTYLLNTRHFPFLAALRRPFTKFCLNNALIPLAFLLVYVGYAIHFQVYYEFWSEAVTVLNILGFLGGLVLTVFLYAGFLQFANKDITHFAKKPTGENVIRQGNKKLDLEVIKQDKNRWRVDTYLNEFFRPRMVRSVAHYESKLLLRIFKQNHMNALTIQFITITVLLVSGYMMDYPVFRIPAGASIFILASIFVALIGGVAYWIHEWRFTVLIAFLIVANFVTRLAPFHHRNQAYGLSYDQPQADYGYRQLAEIYHADSVQTDIDSTLKILDRWRGKFGTAKPKLVLFSISGGGLKASVWTMHVLQKVDSLLHGQLFDHTVLMTGASGGMIGASYFRELNLRQQNGENINPYASEYLGRISKDLLNSVAFAIVSNDFFLPFYEFEYSGKRYKKDRGYMFELQFNENTAHILDKPLTAYREPERRADIPMVIISPSVVNDARRLLISPQGVSYLSAYFPDAGDGLGSEIDAVDFRKMFRRQQADSLRFTTALRMNATYPWILPNVVLPSQPAVEVMDAGFRDNLGILSATRFVQVFKNWILENTSGVVMVQISSVKEERDIPPSDGQGAIESLLNPLGVLGHIIRLQDFEHEANLSFLYDLLGEDRFEMVRFIYEPHPENERASMTFHLTSREKKDILNALSMERNQQSIKRLQLIFGR